MKFYVVRRTIRGDNRIIDVETRMFDRAALLAEFLNANPGRTFDVETRATA